MNIYYSSHAYQPDRQICIYFRVYACLNMQKFIESGPSQFQQTDLTIRENINKCLGDLNI